MRLSSAILAFLLLAAPPAMAFPTGGVNLTWGTGCWEDNPSTLKTFACDTNVGSASLTASFAFEWAAWTYYMDAKLDLQSDSPQLPDWWQFTCPAGCRAGSMSVSADFTGAPGGCADPWLGRAQVTWYWVTAAIPGPYQPVTAPSRARLKVSMEFPQVTFIPNQEYYAFRVTLNYARSTGSGACAGCATPVTIVFNDLWILTGHLTAPLSNACLRWQADGTTPCSATPARNSTWGQVKSLYR